MRLIGDGIRTSERNVDIPLNACKHVSLGVNIGKLSTWQCDVIEARTQMSISRQVLLRIRK